MRKIIIFAAALLLPFAVSAKNISVGVVAAENISGFAGQVKNEIESFITGSSTASVKLYTYPVTDGHSAIDNRLKEADAESDITVVVGETASGRASVIDMHKPSVAVFAPRQNGFTTVIRENIDHKSELDTFRKLFKYEKLNIIASEYSLCSAEICREGLENVAASVQTPYKVVSLNRDFGVLGKSLESGDTALVLDQPQLSVEKQRELYTLLAKMGVYTFTFGAWQDAEMGVLAVNSTEKERIKTARTAAIAVADIADGKTPQKEIVLTRANGLVINMQTAAKAGFSPAWEYLRTADLIHYGAGEKGDYISFKEAIRMALEGSEEVASGKIDLETAKQMLEMSKSAFRPTLSLSSSYAVIDDDRAKMASGTAPEKTLDVALSLRQILYSEEVFSLKDQAGLNEKAKKSLEKQAELDIMQAAAKAYYGVLKAKTYLKITLDNLETTKSNYELAKNRELAGAAGPAELHNWEARIALAKIEVSNADNMLKTATTELARLTGSDIDGTFRLEPQNIKNNYTLLNIITENRNLLKNRQDFEIFKKAMTESAVKNSVEIEAIKYLTKAAEREVLSAKRKFYLPTVGIGGEYKRYLNKSGEGDTAPVGWYDDTEWSVALKAEMPIYEGGKRVAEMNIKKADARKLYHERARVAKLVRQRMIVSLENAKAAYDNYMLARESAEAAEKTLKLVADMYSKGAVSITELIEAQNSKLNADMNTAANEYGFLEKIIDVERAYGNFYVFSGDEDNRKIMELLSGSYK